MAGQGRRSLATDYIMDKLLRMKLTSDRAIIGRRGSRGRTDGERRGPATTVHCGRCVCFHSLHETGRSLTLLRLQVTIVNKGTSPL